MNENSVSEKELLEATKEFQNDPYSLESSETISIKGHNAVVKQFKLSQIITLTYNEIYFVNEPLRAILNSAVIEFICENMTDKGQLPKKLVTTIASSTTTSYQTAERILTQLRKHKYVVKLGQRYYIDTTKIFPKRKINNKATYRVIQIMWEMYNETESLKSFDSQKVGSIIYHIDEPNVNLN